jgi:hypothetical protein
MGSAERINRQIDLYSHSLVRSMLYGWKCHSELTPFLCSFSLLFSDLMNQYGDLGPSATREKRP